jgi:hypothetical protein
LPYICRSEENIVRKLKRTIGKQRRVKAEMPDIFVRISQRDGLYRTSYAKASIRVKSGQYLYLVWRDRDQVKNFYLGKKANSRKS